MKKYIYIIIILLPLSVLFSQTSNLTRKTETKHTQQEELIFREIESGVKEGNVERISKYFGQQTYFSFSNGTNGYYSSNQAFYVLEDFFKFIESLHLSWIILKPITIIPMLPANIIMIIEDKEVLQKFIFQLRKSALIGLSLNLLLTDV